MALTRQQSVHTYKSSSGNQSFTFEVVVDAQGLVSVRNIRTPLGPIGDSNTALPQTVTDDIKAATELVTVLQLETEVDSGTVTFTGQTSQPVEMAGGLLNNTNYRVLYTPPDGVVLATEDKTTTGFTVVAASAYGATAAKVVAYSVLVKTAQTSDLSGVMTIADTDGGVKTLTFTTPMSTANYRVLLEARGFFDARVSSRTKQGFTIELGHVPPTGTSVDVGYDVFV